MPLFRVGTKIAFFCHVPKCAGTAVSRYIEARFGPVAFLDAAYLAIRDPWNKTSPQHISADDLKHLFPDNFFDASFAVVRHPVSRIISEYHFCRDREKSIPENLSFSNWLKNIPELYSGSRWVLDNHLRPMCEIVPNGSLVFKLELGLERVVSFLDELANDQSGPRTVERTLERPETVEVAVPSQEDVALIEKFYSRDFDRFEYKRRSI